MKFRAVRALSVLAIGGAAFSFAATAQAATVNFTSTMTFTDTGDKLTFASTGLNGVLTVGVPDPINHFIGVTVGSGETSYAGTLSANFVFTVPTPSGSTTDIGTITGGQVNGRSDVNGATLTITWPNQPVEFDFADGTKLDVTLGSLSESCSTNNCLGGPYYMSGTFTVLNGPTTSATPLPAAFPLFASGLGVVGLLARRKKRKAALAA
jgi:hypothetical protein